MDKRTTEVRLALRHKANASDSFLVDSADIHRLLDALILVEQTRLAADDNRIVREAKFVAERDELKALAAKWEEHEIRKATCCNKMEATLELFAAWPCTCTLSVAADPIRVKCYGCVAREALGR